MEIRQYALAELEKAKKYPHVSPDTVSQFETFINGEKHMLRTDNTQHHLCAYFLPVYLPSRSIFLVHHKKAASWIPPGGHVDPGETLTQTVRREYGEELSWKITDEPIVFTGLTVTHIDTPRHPCKTHYDFWYRVEMKERIPFTFDRGEFFDASWFPLEAGLGKMDIPYCRQAVADSLSSIITA